ncbi:MAG: hypothetical protein GYB42_00855 [Alphaproteobacteria bacterium]|nr:hypothetical protein [Alphaproteobacteria bacterium]
MSRAQPRLTSLARWWQSARARTRLAIGAAIVIAIGLAGLTPNVFFDLTLSWPYAALIAAVGWGRSGLGFAPMILLALFGFAQDVTTSAPIGSFALVNFLTFGAASGLSQTFDIERSPGMNYGLPLALIGVGMVLVWLLASFASGHIVRVIPLISVYLATIFLHMLIGPLFDLGIRRGDPGGATL